MAENKTRQNDGSVMAFLEALTDEKKKQDSYTLLEIMKTISGEEPRMWGDSIIGFGQYHYRSASGREGDWFRSGFSPRKQNLALYLMAYQFDNHQDLLRKLGKYKLGKGCLYLNKLADINLEILKELITRMTMK